MVDSRKFITTRDQGLQDLAKETAATMQQTRAGFKSNIYINRVNQKKVIFIF